jgi:hypothetical protein
MQEQRPGLNGLLADGRLVQGTLLRSWRRMGGWEVAEDSLSMTSVLANQINYPTRKEPHSVFILVEIAFFEHRQSILSIGFARA